MGETPLDWFKFYPAAWLGSARIGGGMTIEHEGAYIRLLARAWERAQQTGECGVPDDDGWLAAACRVAPRKWATIRAVLVEGPCAVFERRAGLLVNVRLDREWASAKTKSATATASVNARWHKEGDDTNVIPTHTDVIRTDTTLRLKTEDQDLRQDMGQDEGADAPQSPPPAATTTSLLPSAVVAMWNAKCGADLPRALRLTPDRDKHIRARLSSVRGRDEAWWADYFARISASPWCRGANPRSWRATLDWAVGSEDVVAKVQEGTYDGRRPPTRASTLAESSSARYAAAVRERGPISRDA
ncbi:MAG: DUF1376 domain-containing protein [Chloroflexota bacterium]|nr:DUF1376 domain-containing protein [Chloroflexota bacterium]